MQRVLSFPNARGFGDAGEFVTKRMCFSFMFAIGFLALVAGFLFGRFSFDQELALTRNRLRQSIQKNQEAKTEKPATTFLDRPPFSNPFSNEALDANQRAMETARVATNASQARAIMLQQFLKRSGFDLVSPLRPVSVALAFPHPQLTNHANVLNAFDGLVIGFNDSRTERAVKPEGNLTVTSLKIEGPPVYINFGRPEDYLYLDSIGVTVSGHVVLARAGGLPVADLVAIALDHDAIAVLLYLDPAQTNVRPEIITPKELASLKDELAFDNLILGKTLQLVPIFVVSPTDAAKLFELMSEENPSPDSWRGSLTSLYPIGPGFSQLHWKIQLIINTANIVETHYDVIAAIKGIHEPDRLVVIGASLGENSVNSAALMELSKEFGSLMREKSIKARSNRGNSEQLTIRATQLDADKPEQTSGFNTLFFGGWILDWRPHRSIVVAFWGENFETFNWLTQDVVAYLDLDFIKQPVTTVLGSPLLQPLFEKTAANLTYDIRIPFGSDAALNRLGIPFIQVLDNSLALNGTDSETVGKIGALWGKIAVELASHEKLPFSLKSFVWFLNHTINTINDRFAVIARRHNLFLETLTLKATELIKAMELFNEEWLATEASPEIAIRAMNDKLVSFSHALTCPILTDVSTDRGQLLLTRHLLFARSDSESDSDRDTGMGELQDLLRAMTSADAPLDLQRQIVNLFTDTMQCLRNATIALSDKLDIFISGYS